jgi:hypothetical protein
MKKLSSMLLALAVLAVAGCAGEIRPPTVDVTGRWVGRWVALDHLGPSVASTPAPKRSGTIEMTLTQAGSQYSGNLLVTGYPTTSGPTQGVVSGDQVRVLQPTILTGSLTVQGDTMSGHLVLEAWSNVFGTHRGPIAATLTRRSSDQ